MCTEYDEIPIRFTQLTFIVLMYHASQRLSWSAGCKFDTILLLSLLWLSYFVTLLLQKWPLLPCCYQIGVCCFVIMKEAALSLHFLANFPCGRKLEKVFPQYFHLH